MENLEEISKKNGQGKEEEQNLSLENGVLGPIIIEHDEKEAIKYKEEKENELRKRLAYYGITREEWEAVEKYKSSGYFIITTLLHRIDLFEYNYPAYGELYEHIELTNPEKAMETFVYL